MRQIVLVVLGLVACACAFVADDPQNRYHLQVGIPLAAKIKEYEDEILTKASLQDDRIVGGATAPTNAHPYFAGLLIRFPSISGTSVCGSSLVSANRVLTAAHCWSTGASFTVVLGTNFLYTGGLRISASGIALHPQWTPATLRNDVAVIYLPNSVPLTASIQPVSLPNFNQLNDLFEGEWATAAGYGLTFQQQNGATSALRYVNLQVISVAACRTVFGPDFVYDSTLCTSGAGNVGICNGDSGGPLVLNRNGQNILIGISSFVASGMCDRGFPSAYARVTSFYSFILGHL